MIAFILGNGISRRGISASVLKKYGAIYGCNALHRDFTPDVLVATDKLISTSIQESGYAKSNLFYTRKPIDNLGAVALPEKYAKSASGPNAVYLAALNNHEEIYLLGFDMGAAPNNKINNIYAGSEFYVDKNSIPTSPDRWISDLVQIIQENRHIKFIRVLGIGSASVPNIHNLPNVTTITVSEFLNKFK